jgi:hypothetical protein
LTDAAGGSSSIIIEPANVNDHKLLEATIGAMVIVHPEPTEQAPQNLCFDRGYDNKPGREIVSVELAQQWHAVHQQQPKT